LISPQSGFIDYRILFSLAFPFVLLIFILFVKSTLTTRIFRKIYIRYSLYIIGIGLFLISFWAPIWLLFDDPVLSI
jgi:peptidoglycan/LPS O-acetylase OafA/YrhL